MQLASTCMDATLVCVHHIMSAEILYVIIYNNQASKQHVVCSPYKNVIIRTIYMLSHIDHPNKYLWHRSRSYRIEFLAGENQGIEKEKATCMQCVLSSIFCLPALLYYCVQTHSCRCWCLPYINSANESEKEKKRKLYRHMHASRDRCELKKMHAYHPW